MVSKQIKGSFGVHFVSAELYRCGFIATPTIRNAEAIDILASNLQGSKTITIQVKASEFIEKGHPAFPILSYVEPKKKKKTMSPEERTRWIKNKINPSNQKFYVFVYTPDEFFKEDGWERTPDYYVVPSKQVLDGVLKDRIEYLGIRGGKITKFSKRKQRFLKDAGVWYWTPPKRYLRNIELLRKALI